MELQSSSYSILEILGALINIKDHGQIKIKDGHLNLKAKFPIEIVKVTVHFSYHLMNSYKYMQCFVLLMSMMIFRLVMSTSRMQDLKRPSSLQLTRAESHLLEQMCIQIECIQINAMEQFKGHFIYIKVRIFLANYQLIVNSDLLMYIQAI